MAWVLDSSVVLDLLTGDQLFEPASTACVQAHLQVGIVISPVTFVELGPAFSGDAMAAKRPVADVLILAFAERFEENITRNDADFCNILPTLQIVEP